MNETNATATAFLGAPQGFVELFVTSLVVIAVLILFLAWVANPKQVCKCFRSCWDCKRLRAGASRLLLVSSLQGNSDASESLAEGWWSPENEEANRKDNNKGVHTPTGKLVDVNDKL
jgi:hypothetical protein